MDTGASFLLAKNAEPLDDVVTAKDPITMGTNAGNKTLNKFGELGSFKAKTWKD